MARNMEIKARIDNIEAVAVVAASLANAAPVEIYQDDTFFQCETGRLKLRVFSKNHGELIFYNRPDRAGPKECFYVRSQTTEPASLRDALSLAYGQAGQVRKNRTFRSTL
jgi:adenylate cyclase class IV